jgi:hypothetical protein
MAGMMMLCCIRHIDHMKACFHFILTLYYDPDWHFGTSWLHLLQQGTTLAPAWKAAHIAQELRRWVLNATVYVTLAFRVILYLICFKEHLQPPCFRTTTCLTGLIVSSHNHHSVLISRGLTELGVSVWSVAIEDETPNLKLYP